MGKVGEKIFEWEEVMMGHRIDFCSWMGLPRDWTQCPKCGEKVQRRFEAVDVDCGSPHIGDGLWRLHVYCQNCEYEWAEVWKVSGQKIREEDY